MAKSKKRKSPKIIIWDLETLPDPARVYKRLPSFGAWPGRGFSGELQSVMCFAYMEHGKKKAKSINAWDFPSWKKDRYNDKELIKAAREVLADADAIVTHNGKRYDMRVINSRLMYHGLKPLPKIPHIDTKQLAKRHFNFYSNSLAEVAKFLGLTDKIHWGDKWDSWYKMAFHKETAADRKHMDKYGKYDVIVTDELFTRLMPYATNIPNYNLFEGNERVCPSCGGHKLHKHGLKRTKTAVYQRYQCQDCGSISQSDKKDEKLRSE